MMHLGLGALGFMGWLQAALELGTRGLRVYSSEYSTNRRSVRSMIELKYIQGQGT